MPEPTPPTAQRIIDHLSGLAGQAAKTVHKAANGVTSALPSLPVIHDPLTNNVSHAVQNVINAVSKAGGGTGFPLLLLIIVGIFLMAQSRVDRRDPKLALASVAADDNLQFRPPPAEETPDERGPAAEHRPGAARRASPLPARAPRRHRGATVLDATLLPHLLRKPFLTVAASALGYLLVCVFAELPGG